MYLKGTTARGHGQAQTPEEIRGKVDDMLKNLGERVLQALSVGGQKARQFDDAYSAKVRDMFGVHDVNVNAPMRKTIGAVAGYPATYGPARENPGAPFANFGERAAGYAMPLGGVAARYVLPTAGAVAIADLTGRLYDAASEVPIFPAE